MKSVLLRGFAALGIAVCTLVSATAHAKTVTDVLGREVEIPDEPKRILLGFYFEDFFAVGGEDAYDRVVAISKDTWEGWRNLQWKAYTAAKPDLLELTDIGEVDAGTFSLEAAVAAKPDLAVLSVWQLNALGDSVDRLQAAGIPVIALDYNAQTVERHVASTHLLGAILGEEDRAEKLATEYSEAIDDILARIAKAKGDTPKAYVELARKGAAEVDNSYGKTMWGVLIETAGGKNIAADQIAKWGPLSPEYVLAQNPKHIFLAGSGWASREAAVLMGPGVDTDLTHARMRPYLTRPGWDELDAVKSGNVYAIYHGGARTLYDYAFLQFIAKAMHPEEFADVDPQANLDRFFAEYMPIRFSGTYMTRLK